jgi:ABC-2 type transport system permease protein
VDTTSPAANGSGASLPAADANAEQSTATKDFLAKLVKIEDEQLVGRDVKNPMAARMVGGYAIMFLLFALTGSATSLFEEKQSGIFQRILAAPVRPSHILWSRFLFGIILGAFQLTALFLAGRFMFGLDLESHLGSLAVLTLVSAAACTAFGMLVAAIAPTHEAASGLSTLLVLTMTAIGGAWFPITMMPEFMQKLSRLSLVYWAVEGYSSILWAGHSLRQIAPNLAVLTGISVGVMLLAGYLFKRSKIFE